MSTTSGARVTIPSPCQGDSFTKVSITGAQHSVRTAPLLIKMAVLHGIAGDKLTLPEEYFPDRKGEAELNIAVFYKETQSRAFHTLYPYTAAPTSHNKMF